MSSRIISVSIRYEHDTVAARQRARQIARMLGFDHQDQTRISTAVSEIARNAFNYAGGGRVEYLLEGRTSPQLFLIRITDQGPGIRDLDEILDGRYHSPTGMGLGIIGARRLMDQFEIDSVPGRGTTVLLKKLLPKRAALVEMDALARMGAELERERPQDAFGELQHQNRELLSALDEIRTRQVELSRLNQELEDTNRGVVALYAELDEKADHLRRADELKSRFLSNMSHEFRSPLNSILALTGLLQNRVDGELTSEQEQQVGYIRRAANDLLELVNDLLDLTKVEAGKVEIRLLEFSVANLFAALRGMLRPLLLNQSIDLVFEDVEHIPGMYSDEGKVSQILRNFISNALKFTERGEVRVAARQEDRQVIFSVSDTGIGIAPEDQERIFQEYAQIDGPIQRRVKGTGLGLPLSKKLATLLGGSVSVHSQPGMGSTFSLQVPLRQKNGREEEAPEPAWSVDTANLPILLVEDSPDQVLIYRSLLRGTGFEVIPAATTREAELVLKRIQPAVIVLDIVLRSEDTWAFLAELKTSPETLHIPVVVASTLEDQAKGYHLGADAYLVKPLDRARLLSQLRTCAAPRNPAGTPAWKPRVLIVDDDESARYLLKQQFRDVAVIISEASGGGEGIEKALREKPNLVFLDLTMPDMSGFEVLDVLRSDPETSAIPVVISTSRVLTEDERERFEDRVSAILNKEVLAHHNSSRIFLQTLEEAGLLPGIERETQ